MWIADEPVVFVHPDGARHEGRIAFGLPYRAEGGEMRCPVVLDGLHSRGPDIAGDSALQALLLAIRFAESLLAHFLERGGKIMRPRPPSSDGSTDDSEYEIVLESFFGPLAQSP